MKVSFEGRYSIAASSMEKFAGAEALECRMVKPAAKSSYSSLRREDAGIWIVAWSSQRRL
jgi:hypothetical protein